MAPEIYLFAAGLGVSGALLASGKARGLTVLQALLATAIGWSLLHTASHPNRTLLFPIIPIIILVLTTQKHIVRRLS